MNYKMLYNDLKNQKRSFSIINTVLLNEKLIQAFPEAKGKLLDIGCGERPYEKYLKPYITRYFGFDINPHKKLDFVSSVDHIAALDKSFDSILCTEVLEHLPTPQIAINEIHRILKPGGVLILSAPQEYWLHEEPHDYYRYTKYGLISLLTKNNMFAIKEVIPIGSGWDILADIFTKMLYLTFIKLPFNSKYLHYFISIIQRVYLKFRKLETNNDHYTMGHVVVAKRI